MIAISACSPSEVPEETANSNLSLEDARAALVALVESRNEIVLKKTQESLRTGRPRKGERGWTSIGPWEIHLRDSRFVLTFHSYSGNIFEEYRGVFRKRRNNRTWEAEITNETRAHN